GVKIQQRLLPRHPDKSAWQCGRCDRAVQVDLHPKPLVIRDGHGVITTRTSDSAPPQRMCASALVRHYRMTVVGGSTERRKGPRGPQKQAPVAVRRDIGAEAALTLAEAQVSERIAGSRHVRPPVTRTGGA